MSVETKTEYQPAGNPPRRGLCIVAVCPDGEAEWIGQELSRLDGGCLITYRRVEDLYLNAPTGRVALVVLASSDSAAATRQTLKWLRHRWPAAMVTVIGEGGADEHELTARQAGALYLSRSGRAEDLTAVVAHAAGREARKKIGARA